MEIKPFKAFRFNEAMVGDAGKCIAPPYDVIDAIEQQQLYEKSEYNIVHITKGKTTPSDNETNNQYTRAADYFNTWVKKGILKQDTAESIYAYVQGFNLAGVGFQRFSFIALAKLEDFGKMVRPHEETLDGPKIDRLNLERATAAKFGLVFMLYDDKQKIADKIITKTANQEPLIDFVDEQNVRHRLFAITARNDIDAIAKTMTDKSCIIADGHHRYEVGLSYYKETGNPAAGYQMIAFVNTCDDGVVILPYHRLVGNLKDFCVEKLLAGLKKNFGITEFRFDSRKGQMDARQEMLMKMTVECDSGKNAFGIYAGSDSFYLAVLKNKRAIDSAAPNMSNGWKSLDVSVLHKLVLEELLGIDEKKLASQSNIEYLVGTSGAVDESINKVDSKEKQAVFFMNPVKMQQLRTVAAAGEKIPQKSTYFFPKLYTGLTIEKM